MDNRPGFERERDILAEPEKARLLERASELDVARTSGAEVRELRAAAMEAGISPSAFDTALAEMRDEKSSVIDTGNHRARKWAMGIAAAAVIVVGLVMSRSPSDSNVAAAAAVADQTIELRCMSAAEAAELIRPIMDLPANKITISPDAPHILKVRATPAQLQKSRAAIDVMESRSPGCAVR